MNRYSCAACSFAVVAIATLAPFRTSGGEAGKPAARTQAPPSIVDEVWAMEDSYWRYVKAADVEKYLTLWNKDFHGWPCGDLHPATKATIGDWVREIHDRKIRFTSGLGREGSSEE